MHWLCIPLTVYRFNTWNIPTTQTVWGEPKLNHSLYMLQQPGRRWKWVWVCLQNAIVTAANSHINNYSKNIISLQPVGPLSSVGPWASAPLSPCINAPLGVCYGHRTQVHFIDGILNAQRYRDEILRPIVVPFIHDHHLMLQHDNARPHVARICTQFLEAENIPVLAWPAYSPDMSPIEHVWDALDQRIRQRVPVPTNIQQLRTAIEEEWTNIPQATINNLINSMRRRCVALHEANGGHTRYWLVFGPPIQ